MKGGNDSDDKGTDPDYVPPRVRREDRLRHAEAVRAACERNRLAAASLGIRADLYRTSLVRRVGDDTQRFLRAQSVVVCAALRRCRARAALLVAEEGCAVPTLLRSHRPCEGLTCPTDLSLQLPDLCDADFAIMVFPTGEGGDTHAVFLSRSSCHPNSWECVDSNGVGPHVYSPVLERLLSSFGAVLRGRGPAMQQFEEASVEYALVTRTGACLSYALMLLEVAAEHGTAAACAALSRATPDDAALLASAYFCCRVRDALGKTWRQLLPPRSVGSFDPLKHTLRGVVAPVFGRQTFWVVRDGASTARLFGDAVPSRSKQAAVAERCGTEHVCFEPAECLQDVLGTSGPAVVCVARKSRRSLSDLAAFAVPSCARTSTRRLLAAARSNCIVVGADAESVRPARSLHENVRMYMDHEFARWLLSQSGLEQTPTGYRRQRARRSDGRTVAEAGEVTAVAVYIAPLPEGKRSGRFARWVPRGTAVACEMRLAFVCTPSSFRTYEAFPQPFVRHAWDPKQQRQPFLSLAMRAPHHLA